MVVFAVYEAPVWGREGWVWVGGEGAGEGWEGGSDEVGREMS